MPRSLTSASNIDRRRLCPGSERMEKDLPDIETAESLQGDRLHDYMAHPEYERRVLVPEEQDLLRLTEKLKVEAFETIGIKDEYREERECELGNDIISGHPDLLRVYIGQEKSAILETKFGWNQVAPADLNLQTRVYALLAPTPDVYVAILQPRQSYNDRVTIARYGPQHKEAARLQILSILKACRVPDAPLIAGEEQCRYCRARMICPALREAIHEQLVPFAADVSPDLSKPAILDKVEARLAQASDLQLGGLYSACALARLVYVPLTDEIRRRIGKGQMEGYSLSKEIESRSIANSRRAISLLVLGRILTREQILDICDLSITAVEMMHRKVNDVTAKEAKAEITKVLEGVLEIEKRKPRILKNE